MTKTPQTFQEWIDEQKRLYGIEEEGIQLEVGPDEVFKQCRKNIAHSRYYNVVRYFILLVSRGSGYT